ncbi:MAG: PAS domain-containing protein, partial [Gammaproteobacteria bacterium]
WLICRSITAHQAEASRLHQSIYLYEDFFDKNPHIMFVKGLDGNYRLANEKYLQFAGKGLVGTDQRAIFQGEEAEYMAEQDEKVLKTLEPQVFPGKQVTEQGTRYFQILRFPLFDDNGELYAIGGIANENTAEVEATKSLKAGEVQLRALVESAPEAILISDTNGIVTLANQEAERLFKTPKQDLLDKRLQDLLPDFSREMLQESIEVKAGNPRSRSDLKMLALPREGASVPVEVSVSGIIFQESAAVRVMIRDVSDRVKLETQLRQSQKMDAIGKLTGGMAHDFNNLLGVIMGNIDLAARKLDEGSPAKDRLQTARKAAERGAELSKRMLAVARRQPLQPESIQIEEVLVDMKDLLPRTLGPDIEMKYGNFKNLPPVLVDLSGLENVFLNLAINARDAMPNGGKFYVSANMRQISELDARMKHDELSPGPYVCIAVTDNGTGMDEETLSRVFEPFFTTKERGKGTGLGLAMIYGFAKQSGGSVQILSELGVGTTVELLLPAISDSQVGKVVARTIEPVNFEHGNEKILLVDDEYELLEIATSYLEDEGFQVLAAISGNQALRLLQANPDVDVLLTDIVMPGGMDGETLAKKAREVKPEIKVLYTSGYPSGDLKDKTGVQLDAPLVGKPYTRQSLMQGLHRVMVGTTDSEFSEDIA